MNSFKIVRAGQPKTFRRLALAVAYRAKFKLSDELRPLCLNHGQFAGSFFRGAVIRARSDNAAEHRGDRDAHNRRIELNSAGYHRDENCTAGGDSDTAGQDKSVAALDPGGELIYFRLQPHNLAFIHSGHSGER